ncbi:MAG TPA: ATP-binding protein [Ohtaekwangia sp.]|uniref:sensor histidine kinase n=1 Tax=Ohtaekwangia sp. TaxID=2066019 RepID=UPI002F933C83
MVFKNFRLQVVIRVLILTAWISLLSWCVTEHLYLRSIYLAVAAIVSIVDLLWYIDRFNRDIKTLMNSLLQRDFTTHFQTTGMGKSFDELYTIFNRISGVFRAISTEKEIQYRYLEMLFEHVQVGILSIDANGHVQHANQALKDLLQKKILTNLNSFASFGPSFVQAIRDIRTGETRLIKLEVNGDILQLSLHASEFKLDNQYYKLISMQNIRTELDKREMEAWQKLIRVLSHEIMNSVAPIISLSGTLHGLVEQNQSHLSTPENSLYTSLDKGLDAIHIRSEGLYNFTQTYRKLTGVPQVSIRQTNLKDIVNRVETLLHEKLNQHSVQINISGIDIPVMVDPDLMEHVLINLLINSMEAIDKTPAIVDLYTSYSSKGNLRIHLRDNGSGIDESTLEKIFIPFFTTKKNGSGIGLALTKQILQLHQADIHVSSEPGTGTEFVIVL